MKEVAENRTILLRWILQQVLLIELELKVKSANGTEKNSGMPNLRVQRNSKRRLSDKNEEERGSKRQRQDHESWSGYVSTIPTIKPSESHLEGCQHDSRYGTAAFPQPKENALISQSRSIRAFDEPSTTQNSKPTTLKKAKGRLRNNFAPRKSRKEDKTRADHVLLRDTRSSKPRRENGRAEEFSLTGPPRLRRSIRARKSPERFQ